MRRILLIVAVMAVALVGGLALNTLAQHLGWATARLEPAQLSALLRPYDHIAKPPGDGPFPTALLFSGCDGVHDNMFRWSEMLVAHGWAAIVVDSHTPRGFDNMELWRLVCVGQILPGRERAGDVLVSLADARKMDFVDPDRLALIGMSHGGWAIMDTASLDMPRERPLNLAELPPPPPEDRLDGVRAMVLVYPWCGLLNGARLGSWQDDAPVLFILATDDTIAPSGECELVARDLAETGRKVETLRFDGVTHGFDQQDHGALSTLVFAPEETEQALDRAAAFLGEAFAPD